jgi:hypothetical protein
VVDGRALLIYFINTGVFIMKTRYTPPILIGMFILLSLVSIGHVSLADNTFTMSWSVISGGGGSGVMLADHYSLRDTIGQLSISSASDPGLKIDHGYWSGLPLIRKTYLPITTRDN